MHCLKKYFQQCLCSLPSKGLAYFLMHRFLTTQESWSKCNFLETKREKAPFFVRKLIQTLLSNKWQVYFMKKFSSFFQFQSILLSLISYLGSIYRKLCNHCCNLMKVIHNQTQCGRSDITIHEKFQRKPINPSFLTSYVIILDQN